MSTMLATLMVGAIGLLTSSTAAEQIMTDQKDSANLTLERMRYWQLADHVMPTSTKYLLFTQDIGATNNLRIAWEMVGVVARETGRTLVLPPAKPIYLLDFGMNLGERKKYVFPQFTFEDKVEGFTRMFHATKSKTATKVEDLVNLDQLRAFVPTLTWDEFHARTGLAFENATAKSAQVEKKTKNVCHSLEEYRAVESDMLFMDGGIIREGFACGDWDGLGGPRRPDWKKLMHDNSWAVLTHGFVWHSDAFSIASKVVNRLGLFGYNALHGRYGDFQYTAAQEPPSKIFEHWPSLAEGVKVLYVSTDSPDRFVDVKHKNVQILTWDDLFDAKKAGSALASALADEKTKYTPERWYKLMGPVEEIICTYSRLFVGTKHSSFSGHIQRMRLHARAPNTERLFHTMPVTPAVRRVPKDLSRYRTRQPISKGDIFLQVAK